jgi:ureidoacrylate peracid hydrolase
LLPRQDGVLGHRDRPSRPWISQRGERERGKRRTIEERTNKEERNMDFEDAAMVVVDMQNDFVHEKGAVRRLSGEGGIPEASLKLLEAPIPCIRELADAFRKAGRRVIYIYTAWEPDYSDVAIPLGKMADKAKEAGALVRGSWGAQIVDELTPEKGDHMVVKKAYGAFFQTSLDRVLRNLNIRALVVTGVATNYCVETTIREAVAYGYDVVLVSDGAATFDPDGHKASLEVIASGFGEVMTTEEVLEGLAVTKAQG